MEALVIFLTFLVLMALGVPIGTSLGIAAVITGLLTGAGTILVAYLVSRKRGFRGWKKGITKEILIALKNSIWAILAPLIILGGIYADVFTPTEAAAVAVFYSLFVVVVIYRTVTWRNMVGMLVDASVTSSVIMFIVVFAGIFTWATSVIGAIDMAANFIKGNIDDVAKEAIPFVVMDVIVLIILSLFPILSLYLPVLAGLYSP